MRKKPKDWIPDNVWLNIIALSSMDSFRDIPDSVFRNDGLWRQWYDQEAPEMAKVGGCTRVCACSLAACVCICLSILCVSVCVCLSLFLPTQVTQHSALMQAETT